MGKSKVYYTDMRAGLRQSLAAKLDALVEKAGMGEVVKKGRLAAIKLHFGEKGNMSYIHPVFVRKIVDKIKEAGGEPFLTDTNTLYMGTRGNSVSHLKTAIENGFGYSTVAAPLIIADGLRGEGGVPVKVEGGRHFEKVFIAGEVVNSDCLVVLTHFKCHEMSGFGGALKNIGMGCASREGKLAQHSTVSPVVDPAGCTACSECASGCPVDAIAVGAAAVIDPQTCIGCGRCIAICPEKTINIQWDETTSNLQEKMIEYAKGALAGKQGRCFFVNFVTQISPACDCYGHNDSPIAPDIGILASFDPVAIDKASADLVNMGNGLENSALQSGHAPGGDKFRGVYPSVDWNVQLESGVELGLGSTDYELIKVQP